MKRFTSLLASCLLLIGSTIGTPTTSSTHSSTKNIATSTKLSSTSTKTIATSTKPSSTSTKAPAASCTAATYNINFDERVVNPVLAAANPVGIEDTIFFNSWAVDVNPPTVGVPAHSQPNAIVTAFEQQATNGTPSLTILYPGSCIKSFDLHSFYFGCPANTAATAADVAIQCTIFVAGFRNDKEVAVATYTFTPPTPPVDVPMIQAVLPGSFVELQNVTIIQDDPTLEVLAADNFVVTTHT